MGLLLPYSTINTLQPTLQPLHHQLSHLTYGGVTAMDVPGQERRIGQEKNVYKKVTKINFTFFRLKKKDNDMLNANDRIHTLEDELRNIGSKMSKLENDHHKVIQELNVRHSPKLNIFLVWDQYYQFAFGNLHV